MPTLPASASSNCLVTRTTSTTTSAATYSANCSEWPPACSTPTWRDRQSATPTMTGSLLDLESEVPEAAIQLPVSSWRMSTSPFIVCFSSRWPSDSTYRQPRRDRCRRGSGRPVPSGNTYVLSVSGYVFGVLTYFYEWPPLLVCPPRTASQTMSATWTLQELLSDTCYHIFVHMLLCTWVHSGLYRWCPIRVVLIFKNHIFPTPTL